MIRDAARIKVLVVDDSAFMRRVLSDMLNSDPALQVVGTARNGKDALEKIAQLKPDVVTLDIEMPVLDGIRTLDEIISRYSLPVVMISSATQDGAEATLNALQKGAVDFVAKPSGSISLDINKMQSEIIAKVKAAAAVKVSPFAVRTAPLPAAKPAPEPEPEKEKREKIWEPAVFRAAVPECVVAIGTSTGGPKALYEIIPSFPSAFPAAVLVVQHMPPGFTRSLAERLDSVSALKVKEAEDGEEVLPAHVYIAPGDFQLTVRAVERKEGRRLIVNLTKENHISGHRPSIDVLFSSIAANFWGRTIGVLLTGMGHDGTEGAKRLKEKGAKIIAEDASTCVVFGIPRSAIEAKVVDYIVPLGKVAQEVIRLVRERR